MSKKIPHVHAEVIKAWADGATVEFRRNDKDEWEEIGSPSFCPANQYRVKQEPLRLWVNVYANGQFGGAYEDYGVAVSRGLLREDEYIRTAEFVEVTK